MALDKSQIFAIERPDPKLLTYYMIQSLVGFILAPLIFLPMLFKYNTLRYRFDDKGISMKWGVLFRREIFLTYRKIQDIHLTRNLVERWLGLGSLQIQTASGSSGAEMILVGIMELEDLRDFIYAQMKGAKGEDGVDDEAEQERLQLLKGIYGQLAEINRKLGAR